MSIFTTIKVLATLARETLLYPHLYSTIVVSEGKVTVTQRSKDLKGRAKKNDARRARWESLIVKGRTGGVTRGTVLDSMLKATEEKVYSEEEIRELEREVERAKASIPVYCRKCEVRLERDIYSYSLDGALGVRFTGGYGMFFDDMDNDPKWRFHLCHKCARQLFVSLGFPVYGEESAETPEVEGEVS